MANKQIINVGNQSNDGTGDTIRDAFAKVNSNFDDLYNVAGLGDGLRFIKLREAPSVLEANTVLGINTSATKIVQRTVVASTGISVTITDGNIIIANTATSLAIDPVTGATPLGSDLDGLYSHKGIKFAEPYNDYDTVTKKWVYDHFLSRRADTFQDNTRQGTPIQTVEGSTLINNPIAITTATKAGHLTTKGYADTKIASSGTYAIDPATGSINTSMGVMSGPLVLFRDPITQDDVDWDGKIAATKSYVDNASFVSSVNFYVATSGRDNRTDIPSYKKGRALAYAFKTIGQAAYAAEQMLAVSQITIGVYQKTITTNGGLTDVQIIRTTDTSPIAGAVRITVNFAGGGQGTDAFANGSLFPGCYILGVSSGAIGLVEKIQFTNNPLEEFYDIVPVDYAKTLTSNLTVVTTGKKAGDATKTGTVTFQFVTPNLINIPSFWKGYTFQTDNGGSGTIVDTGYYTDPVTQNVYDQITVNITSPLPNNNTINGANWHVYSGTFALGETLRWGQRQQKTQISLLVESGEYAENYPIRLSNNVSIRGDEFRRTIPKPGLFLNSEIPAISVSPWANIHFRRDTQVDGILVAQLDKSVDYSSQSSYILYATPNQTENDANTGRVIFTVRATSGGNPVNNYSVDPSWKGKVFVGHGGQGEITAVLNNTFYVNLAQNSSFQRKLTSSSELVQGQWHIYTPVNFGYQYLRNSKLPLNYVIPYQPGNYLTSSRLLSLNRGYIQAETAAWIDAQVAAAAPATLWYGFTYNRTKCYRDVGIIVDALAKDLDVGNISNSLTAADSYANVSVVKTLQAQQTSLSIAQIGILAQRIVQNIPTGSGTGIHSYQSNQSQVFDTSAYQSDMAVIVPIIGYTVDSTTVNIIDAGYGYRYAPTVTFVGGNPTRAARATANVDVNGVITSLTITDIGLGYESAPTVVLTPVTGGTPATPGRISIGLTATGNIKSVSLQQQGRGYYSVPSTVVVGDGNGATVSVTVGQVGPFQEITSVTLTNPGSGYSKAYVQIGPNAGGGTIDNSLTSMSNLTSGMSSIIAGNPSFNPPLYTSDMDCFLMNDATLIRYISCQGHGGFMKVLDPEGQILAKSPYTQTASSFSRSKNRHVFSGGILVDGFNGNLQMSTTESTARPDTETGQLVQIAVNGLRRKPQCPTFFINNGIRYEVDFVSEFQDDGSGNSTYQGILNLNPARPGGIYSARITGSGFKTSGGGLTVPVRFGSPTTSGGVKAAGQITIGPSGALSGTSVDFTGVGGTVGVGYVTTAVNMVVGGAILGLSLNSLGSIDRTNVNIISGGQGYAQGCAINFDTASATAVGSVSAVDSNGAITAVSFSNTGSGYASAPGYWFGTGYDQTIQIKNGFIGPLPATLETITAGNRSMLANDFTQMNDLGYGVFATNGGAMENVSMFTYYCYTSYFALNGALLRTLTGSSAYGVYGLVAEGSDPLEIPISMANVDDSEQIVQFQNFRGYTNVKGATQAYAVINGFTPYSLSEVEVNHYGIRFIYTIVSATLITDIGAPANYYMLSLNTNGNSWHQTMADGEILNGVYRVKYQQKFSGFNPSVLTRASVVYSYSEDPQTTYKVSNTAYQGNDISIITSTVPYNYVSIQPWLESTYRQGIYNVTQGGGTGYSPNATVNVTFATPAIITANNALSADQDGTVTTSTVILTNSSGPIHVGMTATSVDGTIFQNVVTWVNTGTSSPTVIGLQNAIKGLKANTQITFYGKAARGTAKADASGAVASNSLVITDSGIGYTDDNSGSNGPLRTGNLNGDARMPGFSISPTNGTGISVSRAQIAGLQNKTTVKINQLSTLDSARVLSGLAAAVTYYYLFGYEGFLFKIVAYRSTSITGQAWAEIDIQRVNQAGVNQTPAGLPVEMMADNLYAGIQKSQSAFLTQRISTLRATSHDLVDIGTGGYADSKWPNDLYGPPLNKPYKDINVEVRELSKGRVFFVTTDQDGTFNVGYLLEVRQSDGTINLNAPVALSNLPSIKLQKGQLIDNFSADPSMTGEANSTVPTERAIVQYIERRLGTSKAQVATQLGLIGTGYLDRKGIQNMNGPINMQGDDLTYSAIQNLANPANPRDGATRGYVDSLLGGSGGGAVSIWGTSAVKYFDGGGGSATPEQGKMKGPLWASADPVAGDPALQVPTKRWVDQYRQLSTLSDVTFTSPHDIDLVGFGATTLAFNTTTDRPIWNATRQIVNLANDVRLPNNTPTSNGDGTGSDVVFTRTANTLTIKLIGSAAGGVNEANNPITDYHVNSGAQIRQYKLLMTRASTTATSPTGTQQQIQNWLGLSAYDPTMFSVTNGWVTLGDSTYPWNGIQLSKLQKIPANTEVSGNKGGILGSTSVNSSTVAILSSGTVVTYLEALTKDGRQTLTGSLTPAFTSSDPRNVNLGSGSLRYNTVYADTFNGTGTKSISLLSSISPQTYVQASTATSNTSIPQRDATGYINGKFVTDPGTSLIPSVDSDVNGASDIGSSVKRFANAYIKTLTPGTSRSGNFFGTWVMTAVGGQPEIIGPDDGSASTGANLGRPKSTSGGGRLSNVYTRAVAADDARMLGMTITNNIVVGSGNTLITVNGTSGLISAGSLTLGTALDIAYGGTGATDKQTALGNLLPTPTTIGTVLTYQGNNTYGWAAGGGGGGGGPSGSLITSSHYSWTVTANQTTFSFPSQAYNFVSQSGQLRVYVNGVRQRLQSDYTETVGQPAQSILPGFNFLTQLDVGDIVYGEVDAYTLYQFTAGNTYYNVSGSIPAGTNPPYGSGQNSVQAALDYIESDKLRTIGGTLNSAGNNGVGLTMGANTTLTVAAGTSTKSPFRFSPGTILATPISGAFEWDGVDLWITQTAGPNRVTLANQDWVKSQGYIKLNSITKVTKGTASGAGDVNYDQATGNIQFIPPDLSSYATQSYVTTQGYLTSTDKINSAGTADSANALNTSNGYQVANLGVGKQAPGGNDLAVKGAITAEGDITAFYTSDINLKTKIETITGALGKVTTLSGITFNWNEKAQGKDQTRREAGVIAQQIQQVLPEAVAEREDGTLAVRYEQLVPLLLEAIKELKAEVDLLKKAGE
jgi:hypothetical protein